MGNTSIVLEDIQKQIDIFLSETDDDGKKLFAQLITQVFIKDERYGKQDELPDDIPSTIKDIIIKISSLKDTDIELAYVYFFKKIDNSELEMACLLPCIPDDKTTSFTQKINRYLRKKSSLDDRVFIQFMQNRNEDKMYRFKAYYIMFTYHHDQKDITTCKYIVDTFRDDFIEFPLWYYTNSQIIYQEEKTKNKADMSEALASAKKCIEIYENDERYDQNYPGIYHNFCELVFYASELGDKESFESNYELAKKYIEEAKNINPKFAKYYYTQGRLLMARCRYISRDEAGKIYDRAEDLYERAIDMEDSSRDGYAIKIVDYETALLRCKTERRLKDIDVALNEAEDNQKKTTKIQEKTEALVQESKTLKDELEAQKRETLELLGFFSGIISLIVVTSQVVLNLDMISATVIMMLFLGTMILAFSFFHYVVLNGTRRTTVPIVLFMSLGVILIVGALIIAWINAANI